MPTKRLGRREREKLKKQTQKLQMAAANNPYELVKALGKEGLLAIYDTKARSENKMPNEKPELKMQIQNDTHRGGWRDSREAWKGGQLEKNRQE